MKPTTRKSFISNSLLTVGALLSPKLMQATPLAPKRALADLSNAASMFSLKPDLAFLNNATMGPSPKVVTDALIEGLEDVTVRGLFGRKQKEAIDTLADFVDAQAAEICLTHNATEAINMVVWGLSLKAGDEIILCNDEHAGNASAWMHRAKRDSLVVKSFKLGNTAAETLSNLKKITTNKTRVFALPHVSCARGQVQPLKEIVQLAKSKNIITAIDGAQALGMLNLNLPELGVDYYATSCHKWLLAPQGTGFLFINKNNLAKLRPLYFGAEGTKEFISTISKPTLSEIEASAHSFLNGTQSGALLNGVIAACQFHNNLGKANINNRISNLNNYLYMQLETITKYVEILTPIEQKSKCGIVCFKLKSHSNKDFRDFASQNGYTVRYVAENNLDAVRVSTHIYNNNEQLDNFIELLKKFVS